MKKEGKPYSLKKTMFSRIEEQVYKTHFKPMKKKLLIKETKKDFEFSQEGEQLSLF